MGLFQQKLCSHNRGRYTPGDTQNKSDKAGRAVHCRANYMRRTGCSLKLTQFQSPLRLQRASLEFMCLLKHLWFWKTKLKVLFDLENECILMVPHGNFCSTSLRRLWWVFEEYVQEQKCGSAPGWTPAKRECEGEKKTNTLASCHLLQFLNTLMEETVYTNV